MNKYEKGYNYLIGTSFMTYSTDKDDLIYHQAVIDVGELVERATPKKVKRHKSMHIMNCPNCNNYIELSSTKFCDDCGQKLDWSEEK
jgi:uncharacterized paraquat-inducible protein A